MEYVIPAPPVTSLRVVGSDAQFPVRRIYCVGRNYAEHAIEMGHDPNASRRSSSRRTRTTSCPRASFPYPPQDRGRAFRDRARGGAGKRAARTSRSSSALDCVFGYAVGLDMTRRDLQGEAKKLGRPWEIGKAFEAFRALRPDRPGDRIGHPTKGADLARGQRQAPPEGRHHQMIWKMPEMIAYLSGLFTLAAGDLIMTGTPAGVGAVKKGDRLVARVDRVGEFAVTVE